MVIFASSITGDNGIVREPELQSVDASPIDQTANSVGVVSSPDPDDMIRRDRHGNKI
jgi:hypothetical protein